MDVVAQAKLKFTSEEAKDGVVERRFELEVAGETVPGLLWTPQGAKGTRPLVLVGHGGSLSKVVGRLRGVHYAKTLGYATAAIDAPEHGDRKLAKPEAGPAWRQAPNAMWTWMESTAPQATREWRATLSALQALPEVGEGPVGYWGVSMGSGFGIPFVAEEPRVKAAVFGLAHAYPGSTGFMAAVRRIAIPVEFVIQSDDTIAIRPQALVVYDAFASKEKALHLNPGPHAGIPSHEAASWEAFYQRHLGRAA